MRPCISIRGSVRPSVRRSVCPLVGSLVRLAFFLIAEFDKSDRSDKSNKPANLTNLTESDKSDKSDASLFKRTCYFLGGIFNIAKMESQGQ